MYVLYTDESGEATNPADRVTVVAGVAVHEDAVRPLAGAVNGILRRYVGRDRVDRFEVHGSPLRGGRKEWSELSRAKRIALAHELLDTICSWEHEGSETQVLPLVVAIDRDHTQTPIEMAYAELLFGFDKTLRTMRRGGDGHNGILVADRGKYERSIAAWVEIARAWKRVPKQEKRRLHALVETPFFVDSRATRLMQLADLVSFAFFRYYNFDDASWSERLMPAMADGRGRILHLATADGCACAACAARRHRATPRSRARRQVKTTTSPRSRPGR